MIEDHPVSAYLKRPARTLRQVCADSAASHGIDPPECDDCDVEDICIEQTRREHRARKKMMHCGTSARRRTRPNR